MSSYPLWSPRAFAVPLCVVAGCGDGGSPILDGGDPTADASTSDYALRELRYEGDTPLKLGFGEEAELTFLYLDPETGDPASGDVEFTIDGNGGDSSLLATVVAAGEEGRVSTTLRAGTIQAASFRVRATAPDAANAYVEASVSDAGFGDVTAIATYAGERALASVELLLYSGVDCSSLDPHAPPIADRNVVAAEEDEGRWTGTLEGLAVGPSYAILARAHSAAGGLLASGCAAPVEVLAEPDRPAVEIWVPLSDLRYAASGRFILESHFDLAETVAPRVETWLGPARDLVGGEGGTAGFMVAEIAAWLGANLADGFDAFEERRQELTTDLEQRLAETGADASVLVSQVGGDLQQALSSPTLISVLSLDTAEDANRGEETIRFSHESLDLRIPLAVDGADRGERDVSFGTAGVVSVSSGDAELGDERLSIGEHRLPFLVGTLAVAILDESLVPEYGNAGSLEDWLWSSLGAQDVASWLADSTDGPCDQACYEAGCWQAVHHLADTIRSGLLAGDLDVSELTLEGDAAVADDDGDALTDSLTGSWTGTLAGEIEVHLESDFSGSRRDLE